MIVMIVYVLLVVAGQVLAFLLGTVVDRMVPSGWSMIAYMGLFFSVLGIAWPIAVFITERWFVKDPAAGAGEAKASAQS